MPGTYSNLLYHFVFSTKGRRAMIKPELRPRLYEYIGGVIRGEKGTLYEIGGMPDHVHLLMRWRTDEAISTLLRKIKSSSSGWVHDTFPILRSFGWQEGYGAFTVSHSQCERVKKYIQNQERHHRGRDFKKEFLALLDAHEIEYDLKYVFE